MTRRFVAAFENEGDILAAVKAFRRDGFEIDDAFTPYAVHGLDEAAGVERSRLGYLCGIVGLSAAALGLYFQHWVSAVDWPLNVGGKPLSSIPAFVPVTFEIGVLLAGLGTVFSFFVVSRLYPGKRPQLVSDAITDDRFVVVLEAGDQGFDREKAEALARRFHAIDARMDRTDGTVRGRDIERDEDPTRWRRLNLVLAIALFALVGLNLWIEPRATHRGTEFLPEMIDPVAAESFSSGRNLPGASVLQAPPTGTISRGRTPLVTTQIEASLEHRLEPGPGGAAAAATIRAPWTAPDESTLERGAAVYQVYCQLCHGPTGAGEGLVVQRGFPAPPSLLEPHAVEMADGQIFHVISMGQGNMPRHDSQIDPLDRWRAVMWVRSLQATARAGSEAGRAPSPSPSEGGAG